MMCGYEQKYNSIDNYLVKQQFIARKNVLVYSSVLNMVFIGLVIRLEVK